MLDNLPEKMIIGNDISPFDSKSFRQIKQLHLDFRRKYGLWPKYVILPLDQYPPMNCPVRIFNMLVAYSHVDKIEVVL